MLTEIISYHYSGFIDEVTLACKKLWYYLEIHSYGTGSIEAALRLSALQVALLLDVQYFVCCL